MSVQTERAPEESPYPHKLSSIMAGSEMLEGLVNVEVHVTQA